jgi:hypothetical protein
MSAPYRVHALMAALCLLAGEPAHAANSWLGIMLSTVACNTADGSPLSGAWS